GSGALAGVSQAGGGLAYRGGYYVSTGCDDVFALNGTTGKMIWKYRSGLGAPTKEQTTRQTKAAEPGGKCGATGISASRGIAMGDGKIYVGQIDDNLVALNQATGKVAWKTQIASPKAGYSITGAPSYFDGMVLAAPQGGDVGTRGFLDAYDSHTGK